MGKWIKPLVWTPPDGVDDTLTEGCDFAGCTYCPGINLVWAEDDPSTNSAPITIEDVLDTSSIHDLIAEFKTGTQFRRGWKEEHRASKFRTQKARGVNAIKRGSFPNLTRSRGMVGNFPNTLYTLPHDGMSLCKSLFAGSFPKQYFVRPCPTVPRHGFVESRIVECEKDMRKVVKETLDQDPDGEVLIMPVLSGWISAVAHNAGIDWGHGHDGVTGAQSDTTTIPCPIPPNQWSNLKGGDYDTAARFYDTWDKDFEGQVPYIELVEHNMEIVPVQVRAGPAQAVGTNYIPRTEVVKRIFSPKIWAGSATALLDWEKLVEKEIEQNGGTPDGLVVWSKGLSLASHWAIHAIQAGIAVITGSPPVIGQTIEAKEAVVPPLNNEDLHKLADYIQTAQRYNFFGPFEPKHVILTAMASAHAHTFWGNASHLLRLRAIAVEMIARFVGAACLGEDRHFYATGPGRSPDECEPNSSDYECREDYQEALQAWSQDTGDKRSHLDWEAVYGKSDNKRVPIDRTIVYSRMLTPMDVKERRKLVHLTGKDFRMSTWGGDNDSTSYGGTKWAECADAAVALEDATARFVKSPTRGNWDKLSAKMNMACHVAHNGGGVLTKWLKQDALNQIAFKPTFGFMNFFAGWIAVKGWKLPRKSLEE